MRKMQEIEEERQHMVTPAQDDQEKERMQQHMQELLQQKEQLEREY